MNRRSRRTKRDAEVRRVHEDSSCVWQLEQGMQSRAEKSRAEPGRGPGREEQQHTAVAVLLRRTDTDQPSV